MQKIKALEEETNKGMRKNLKQGQMVYYTLSMLVSEGWRKPIGL